MQTPLVKLLEDMTGKKHLVGFAYQYQILIGGLSPERRVAAQIVFVTKHPHLAHKFVGWVGPRHHEHFLQFGIYFLQAYLNTHTLAGAKMNFFLFVANARENQRFVALTGPYHEITFFVGLSGDAGVFKINID